MRARRIAAFLALTLVVPAFAAPVPAVEVNTIPLHDLRRSHAPHHQRHERADAQDIVVRDLEARSDFHASYTFTGEEIGPAQAPKKAPTTPRAQKAQDKKVQARKALQSDVQKRVQAVLNKAGPVLQLPAGLSVNIYTKFHDSRSDPDHATFKFTAPVCGGTCVGHAYQTDQNGVPGRIFNAAHDVIYPPQKHVSLILCTTYSFLPSRHLCSDGFMVPGVSSVDCSQVSGGRWAYYRSLSIAQSRLISSHLNLKVSSEG